MQPATLVHGVPFKKNPRNGQMRVFNEAVKADLQELTIKFSTGYGKTFTAVGVYSIRQKHHGINRLLYITPTSAQHEAFCRDGHCDLQDAGVTGPLRISDIGFYSTNAIRHHRNNEMQVFAITIQALCASGGFDIVAELLQTGRWMIVVDEYHHYGIDKAWGQRVRALNHAFLLAMSATPYRPNEDGAFGKPLIEVPYREAVAEKAVKPLSGHSYVYRLDSIIANEDVISMTTSELAAAAGGDDPDKIEKFMIRQKMRWSPKYVSPLVQTPIERMLGDRIRTGYKLQAIIGAMCVSHAASVCDQLKSMFPELAIDWVGTGENGRKQHENRKIIEAFCPPKLDNGKRGIPQLDILVHVGMAGEGLDTCNVSEIVHLNNASLNNSNIQENGRASRYLDGVTGNINYDSSSGFAEYVGSTIMDAMEFQPPSIDDVDPQPREPNEYSPLPDEPKVLIVDIVLDHIDSGTPGVDRFVEVMRADGHTNRSLAEMVADPDPTELDHALILFNRMRAHEAEQFNERAEIEQRKQAIDAAVSVVAGLVIRKTQNNGHSVEKSLAGDLRKKINSQKKRSCGAVTNDLPILKRHYDWIKNLEQIILHQGIPSWLW